MQVIDFTSADRIMSEGHTSKGDQPKWKQSGNWYKADHMGYEALKKAIESARVKAEAMAEAGGCKLGTMTNVQEYSSGQQARYYDTSYSSGMAMKETAMEDAGAGRNLMPGQVDVEAEVSATFSIQ